MTISLAIASLVMMGEAQGSQVTFESQPQITQVSYEEKEKEKNLDFYENNEIIVKTSNPEVLRERGYEISPLINWEIKNPELLKDFVDIYIVKIPEFSAMSIKNLENIGSVEYVELDPIGRINDEYIPTDEKYPEQWNLHLINMGVAWNVTLGDTNAIIYFLDTGLAPHDEYKERVLPGRNCIDNNGNTADVNGHGTIVAGIAISGIDNGGIAGISQCYAVPVRVTESDGSYKNSTLAQGLLWALDQGAEIFNISLGGTSSTTLENAVKTVYNEGGTIICGAGNGGSSEIDFPGRYTETICVLGVDENDQKVSSSDYGPEITIAAPGDFMWTTTRDGGYTNKWRGTSLASAHPSAVIASIKSLHPEYTREDLKKAILETADTITVNGQGEVLRLNAGGALKWEKPGIEEQTPTQRPPELTDIILNPSNLYQENFPGRGTLTIYEASTGRRVQAPIQVYGHVDVDFSGFPAGVYFGVYKPQEGRHQVGKIIKTQ